MLKIIPSGEALALIKKLMMVNFAFGKVPRNHYDIDLCLELVYNLDLHFLDVYFVEVNFMHFEADLEIVQEALIFDISEVDGLMPVKIDIKSINVLDRNQKVFLVKGMPENDSNSSQEILVVVAQDIIFAQARFYDRFI